MFKGKLWDQEGRNGWNSQACRTVLRIGLSCTSLSTQRWWGRNTLEASWREKLMTLERTDLPWQAGCCPAVPKQWSTALGPSPWVTPGHFDMLWHQNEVVTLSWSSPLPLCRIDKTWVSILSVWVKETKKRANQGPEFSGLLNKI